MSFANIIESIGIVSMIGGLIYIGRKLQILDDLKDDFEKIDKSLIVISDYIKNKVTE